VSVVAGLWVMPLVPAEPPTIAQAEISQLLEDVRGSGCAFYRNGSWYDAKKAESHLRTKYQMGRDRLKSAEDFIDRVASKSSLSGRAYEIRCSDGVTIPFSAWLYDSLRRDRSRGIAGSAMPPPSRQPP
jgi:hypothetical protein